MCFINTEPYGISTLKTEEEVHRLLSWSSRTQGKHANPAWPESTSMNLSTPLQDGAIYNTFNGLNTYLYANTGLLKSYIKRANLSGHNTEVDKFKLHNVICISN